MSDYLSNLAARTLNQANAVQPRPMPLFAPSPHLDAWPPAEQSEMDGTEYQPSTRGAAPVPMESSQFYAPIERAEQSVPVPPPTRLEQNTPIEQQSAHAIMPSALPPTASVGPVTQPASPAVPTAAPEHVLIERVVAAAGPLPIQPAPQLQPTLGPVTERLVIERVHSTPAQPAQESATLPIQPQKPNPTVKEVTIERMIQPVPQEGHPSLREPSATPTTKQPSTVPPMPVQPRITPASHHEPAQAPPATPAPTIQVTIGRIEVRASASSVQPRAPRAAQPTMSLEDYLKSRSGGGR